MPDGQVVTAEQLVAEAQAQLSLAENVRDGTIRAVRDEHGVIRYSITGKGRAMVEAMGHG